MATRRARSVTAVARRAFKIKGIEELQAELSKLVNEVTGKEMKDVYVKAAIELRDEARRLAPVRTGELKRAIFAARGDENKSSALVGVNYGIAPHAHLVEFGHAGPHPAPPHPYMRPAVASKKDAVKQIITDGLGEIVKKYS